LRGVQKNRVDGAMRVFYFCKCEAVCHSFPVFSAKFIRLAF
jgi:hypothetical protein